MTRDMTYHEFLDWANEDTLAKWVNGKVIMTSPASLRHQLIAQFLGRVLAGYVEVGRLGIVVSAPFQMKLEQSGREPDVFFLAEAHRDPLPSVEQTLLAVAGERYARYLHEQLRQQGFTGEPDKP